MAIYMARRTVGFVQHMEVKRLALRQRDGKRRWGHGEWAAYLDMDRSLWYLLRRGDKELSIAVMQRVLREWPQEFEPFLKDAVLAWREKTPGDRPEPLQEVEPEGA
jgi:hypothetical protein